MARALGSKGLRRASMARRRAMTTGRRCSGICAGAAQRGWTRFPQVCWPSFLLFPRVHGFALTLHDVHSVWR